MKCKSCNTENPEGALHCMNCGKLLDDSIVCPACGTKNPAEAIYCVQCGTRLDGSTVCPDCGTNYKGNFCPKCGTPTKTETPGAAAKAGTKDKPASRVNWRKIV